MSKTFDLNNLKSTTNRLFIKTLQLVPTDLTPSQAQNFFKISLGHFNTNQFEMSKLNPKTGEQILNTIYQVLLNEKIRNLFITNEFIKQLPYSSSEYSDSVLDILYLLVKHSPEAIIDDINKQFLSLSKLNPSKSLIILAIYSQSLDRIDVSWSFLDVLFKNSVNFEKNDLIHQYFSLIVTIIQNNEDFQSGRLDIAWNTVCKAYKSNCSESVITLILYTLSYLAEIDLDQCQTFDFPFDIVSEALQQPETQNAAISLLLRIQPSITILFPQENSKKILKSIKTNIQKNTSHIFETFASILSSLFQIASTDFQATLILMKMAFSSELASLILNTNDGKWIGEKLPLYKDTIRLFGIILTHKELRENATNIPEVTDLFNNLLVEFKDKNLVCNILCTLFRRLELTSNFIELLSESNFFISFFNVSKDYPVLLFLFIDTAAKICYIDDYIDAIDIIISILKNAHGNSQLIKAAFQVCLSLCKYPQCIKAFQTKGLQKFLNRPSPDVQKLGNQIVQKLTKSKK